METVFAFIKYGFLGFFALIGLLFVLAIIFGKRMIKQWEFEAEFKNAAGREFGEFDIELSRIAKQETEDSFKAEFKMRHESLGQGQQVQVYLDDALVMQGDVSTAGRIYLTNEHVVNELGSASAGQVCRVVIDGQEQFSESIVPD